MRVTGHVEGKNSSPVMRYDEEAIQDAKEKRGHGEEVLGGNRLAVIVEECRPSFCRLGIPRRLPHPAKDRWLRNLAA